MYPTKDRSEERIKRVDIELEVLLKQRQSLNNHIKKLEYEKGILNNLIEIYDLDFLYLL